MLIQYISREDTSSLSPTKKNTVQNVYHVSAADGAKYLILETKAALPLLSLNSSYHNYNIDSFLKLIIKLTVFFNNHHINFHQG